MSAIILPIFEMRKLEHRRVETLPQGHRAGRGLNARSAEPESDLTRSISLARKMASTAPLPVTREARTVRNESRLQLGQQQTAIQRTYRRRGWIPGAEVSSSP